MKAFVVIEHEGSNGIHFGVPYHQMRRGFHCYQPRQVDCNAMKFGQAIIYFSLMRIHDVFLRDVFQVDLSEGAKPSWSQSWWIINLDAWSYAKGFSRTLDEYSLHKRNHFWKKKVSSKTFLIWEEGCTWWRMTAELEWLDTVHVKGLHVVIGWTALREVRFIAIVTLQSLFYHSFMMPYMNTTY